MCYWRSPGNSMFTTIRHIPGFRKQRHGWATCLLTQSAFVRLSMNPHVVHAPLSCRAALDLLNGLVAHPQHRFVSDAPALAGGSLDAIVPRVAGYRQMTDVTLLFLARSHGLQLVTFDQAI